MRFNCAKTQNYSRKAGLLEHSDRKLIQALAGCFSSGGDAAGILRCCARMLGREWWWLKPVVTRFAEQGRPRRRQIERFLADDPGVKRALTRLQGKLEIRFPFWGEPRMLPVTAAQSWVLPPLPTLSSLADWLWIEKAELHWFADLKGIATGPKLGHYDCRVLSKRTGGVRLIEQPKPRLKAIQRQILAWILDHIPTHAAAHGFVKGRSTKTFAAPHVGQAAVLRMDLKDFFPAVRRSRVQALFRTAGYPEAVADSLGGLCTTITPRAVLADREDRLLYVMPHLPQGAPTSPALANLCAYRLDCRLTAFAEKLGASYTRYADDLSFSGGWEFARSVEDLPGYVGAILAEEGFTANFYKTRVMRASVRQRLAGLVVNKKLNVARKDFDLLKATLINCSRLGPASQNREAHPDFRAHLQGRVSYAASIHAAKGEKLRQILERVSWAGSS